MMSRRELAVAGAAMAALTSVGQAKAKGRGPAKVEITGPVTGGARGKIFGATINDLAQHGYIEEEYFVSGVAQNYVPVGVLPADGKWKVKPSETAPYKTRVIIHRPKDPAKFNGTLIAEWTNVSTGAEISTAVNEGFYKQGAAYVAISAQKIGIEGFPPKSGQGLHEWDPERYGSLQIAGDSYSYDIFTQVARALATPTLVRGVSPMAGLAVKHTIALGESQSATRLAAYLNAVHPLEKFFSGFMVVVHVGGATELSDFVFDSKQSLADNNTRRRAQLVNSLIRDDIGAPVLILNSETEATFFRGPPQPDSKWVRVWEVAGAVHASAAGSGYRPDISARDGVKGFFGGGAKMVDFLPIMEAAAIQMARWVEGGEPLSHQPRLLRGSAPLTLARDEIANAIGGVRLPEVAVPTATFDTSAPPAFGTRKPLSPEKIRQLYPTDELYVALVRAAVERSVVDGVILPAKASEYLQAAAAGPLVAAQVK